MFDVAWGGGGGGRRRAVLVMSRLKPFKRRKNCGSGRIVCCLVFVLCIHRFIFPRRRFRREAAVKAMVSLNSFHIVT